MKVDFFLHPPFFSTKIIYALSLSLIFYKCGNKQSDELKHGQEIFQQCNLNQHLLQSVLWFQTSGEMMALYYQAYNMAQFRFDEKFAQWKKLSKTQKKLKPAVVVDIDETILDNSPFEGYLLQKNVSYEDSLWAGWIRSVKAEALPGALEFLKHVKNKGAEVFYVSNRYTGSQKELTRKNLQQLGFPNSEDTTFMLFREKESSKEIRRKLISESYDILLLCGDNLSDLSALYDNRDKDAKINSVKAHSKEFGDKFIILPNPMYGDWEKSLWNGIKYSGSAATQKKDSARYSKVLGW